MMPGSYQVPGTYCCCTSSPKLLNRYLVHRCSRAMNAPHPHDLVPLDTTVVEPNGIPTGGASVGLVDKPVPVLVQHKRDRVVTACKNEHTCEKMR